MTDFNNCNKIQPQKWPLSKINHAFSLKQTVILSFGYSHVTFTSTFTEGTSGWPATQTVTRGVYKLVFCSVYCNFLFSQLKWDSCSKGIKSKVALLYQTCKQIWQPINICLSRDAKNSLILLIIFHFLMIVNWISFCFELLVR